jgi:hypothetical protein
MITIKFFWLSFVHSGFSSKQLVDAVCLQGQFYDLIQSDAFIKSLNKRIEPMCQRFRAGDVIDVQPVIRSMTFDVVFGEWNTCVCI